MLLDSLAETATFDMWSMPLSAGSSPRHSSGEAEGFNYAWVFSNGIARSDLWALLQLPRMSDVFLGVSVT